jgi:tetratricopeptide (TPR) repeat protein
MDAALAAYRAALDVSPDWAAGHYNAALVAGQLERYGLAITEMRRYLYLEPNAPDARAAQDQIYRWEVLMAQP